MMLQPLATLHRAEVPQEAIVAVAHARETAVSELAEHHPKMHLAALVSNLDGGESLIIPTKISLQELFSGVASAAAARGAARSERSPGLDWHIGESRCRPLPQAALYCYLMLHPSSFNRGNSSNHPKGSKPMRYLHTMLRVRNLDTALKFYADALGLKEVRRIDSEKGRFTLVFLCAAEDMDLLKNLPQTRGAPLVELTYNWDQETIRRRSQFRPPGLRGRRYLRHLRPPDEARCHHQPPAARRQHGLRALARLHLDRAAAEGRSQAAAGAVEFDAEHRPLVTSSEVVAQVQ